MEKSRERKLIELLEETEAEKGILINQIEKITEELTATRKKLVMIAEVLEELAEKYEVGQDVVKSIITKIC